MTITKRSSLNRPMTWAELDGNFEQVDSLVTQANSAVQTATQQAQSATQSATQSQNSSQQSQEFAQSAASSAAQSGAAVQTLRDDLLSSDVTKGDALINVKSPLSGSVIRTQHSKNQDVVSILDFVSDLSADATTSLVASLASNRTVLIPSGITLKIAPMSVLQGMLIVDGILQITDTCTMSCAMQVRSGEIKVDAGKTLTITGSFVSGYNKIFTGVGTVTGIREVWPEWWGAISNNTTDSTIAINAAFSCLAGSSSVLGMRPKMNFLSGRYLVSATLTANITANTGMEIAGQGIIFSGTRIVAAASFTGTQVLYIPGTADTTQRIIDFKLRDFGIVPATIGSGPTVGLQIGNTGNMINGLRESLVENIYISGFATDINLVNPRLMKFARVSMWNNNFTTASTCLSIQSDGKFAGDISFENCQFVNSQTVSGSKNISITCKDPFDTTGDRSGQVAGVRFTECIIYPADNSVYVASSNGAHIDDLFFVNCQIDGDSNQMFNIIASTGSQVNDVQICHNYLYGGNKAAGSAQIQFTTGGTGTIKNVRVESNTIGSGINRAVNFTTSSTTSINGIIVNGNNIVDFNNTTNPAIEFGAGCSRIQCNNNIATRTGSGTFPYLVQIDTGANYYVITGNLSAGIHTGSVVNEVTQGANRVVANNL